MKIRVRMPIFDEILRVKNLLDWVGFAALLFSHWAIEIGVIVLLWTVVRTSGIDFHTNAMWMRISSGVINFCLAFAGFWCFPYISSVGHGFAVIYSIANAILLSFVAYEEIGKLKKGFVRG